jgi:hypothetical protein
MSESTGGSRFDGYAHGDGPVVTGSIAANRARYLSGLTLAELAEHVGAFAAECTARGIPLAAVEAGAIQARLEYRAEAERTVAMVTACERGQQGGGDNIGRLPFSEAADTPIVLPPSDGGIEDAYPLFNMLRRHKSMPNKETAMNDVLAAVVFAVVAAVLYALAWMVGA